MIKAARMGANLQFNDMRLMKSLVSRISQQGESNGVLQHPQGSLQQFHCRGTATNITTDKTPALKRGPAQGSQEYTCVVAEKSDKEEIVNFVFKHFLKREPLVGALNINASEARSIVELNVKDALKQRSSFVTKDREGKICGVRLNAIGHAEEVGTDIELSPRMKTILTFVNHVDSLLPEKYQQSRFMRHIVICVNPEIARTGVATMMMQKSVEYSQENNLQYMIAMCTGKIATGLALKVGFKTVVHVPYLTYVDPTQPEDRVLGPEMAFLSLVDEHKGANLMVREV